MLHWPYAYAYASTRSEPAAAVECSKCMTSQTTNSNSCDRAVAQVKYRSTYPNNPSEWTATTEEISKKGIKLILKTIGNRKGDCAWSCCQTQPGVHGSRFNRWTAYYMSLCTIIARLFYAWDAISFTTMAAGPVSIHFVCGETRRLAGNCFTTPVLVGRDVTAAIVVNEMRKTAVYRPIANWRHHDCRMTTLSIAPCHSIYARSFLTKLGANFLEQLSIFSKLVS